MSLTLGSLKISGTRGHTLVPGSPARAIIAEEHQRADESSCMPHSSRARRKRLQQQWGSAVGAGTCLEGTNTVIKRLRASFGKAHFARLDSKLRMAPGDSITEV